MARRGRGPRKSKSTGPKASRISVDILSVEMVAGHDGLLRGHPEPALVVGLYLVGGGSARLVGRGQVTLHARGSYPLVVTPGPSGELVRAQVVATQEQSFALLAIALERDGGRDVAEIYGALPDVGTVRLWEAGPAVPSPVPIDELARAEGAPSVRVVQAIVGERDLGRACDDDDLVGACLAVRPRAARTEELRLPFATADGRNDWTAVVRFAVR